MTSEPIISTNGVKSRYYWLSYAAEFITIFFALALLTGRVYAQSYWDVFGLSPELSDTALINYAILSPNTTVACIFVATGTVIMLVLFRSKTYDFIGNANPTLLYIIGWLFFGLGIFTLGWITQCNLSSWPEGILGLVFGLAYFFAIGGQIIWVQAMLKRQNELSKIDKILFGWLQKFSIILIKSFIVFVLIISALACIFITAKQFGTNEAKEMLITRPEATLQLDSPNGFEDIPLAVNRNGMYFYKVLIIAETNEFLYVFTGGTLDPPQLDIRAVPISRVQTIKYMIDVTPIGE